MSTRVQVLIDAGDLELDDESDLTPATLVRNIKEIDSLRAAKDLAEQQNRDMRAAIKQWGIKLQSVIDSDANLMQKFTAFRELSNEAAGFGELL